MKTKTYKKYTIVGIVFSAILSRGFSSAAIIPCEKNSSCEKENQAVGVLQSTADEGIQGLADLLNSLGTSDTSSGSTTISLDGFGSLIPKIFKVQAYSYDSFTDSYVLQQYGSSVLVAKNLLLTNAHVISDESNNPLFNYEVCQTTSAKEEPDCFSSAKLLVYDTKNDLALLQISKTVDTDPVIFATSEVQIGGKVDMLGYPANGGSTITATQGSIAGYQNGYYKTDANIDEGNSGGGAFDASQHFVGIPTFAVNGLTTMGYVIPLEKINAFLKGETGTKSTRAITQKFENYLSAIYTIKDEGVISNKVFSTPSFKDIGLSLWSAEEKSDYNFFSYDLYDKDDNQLSLRTIIASKNANMTKYVNNNYELIKSAYGSNVSKTSKKIGNTTWSIISYVDTDNGQVGALYIQTNAVGNTFVELNYNIQTSNTELLNDINEFVAGITIKSSTSSKSLSLPGVKLSTKRGVSIFKQRESDGMAIFVYPENRNANITIKSEVFPTKISDQTLKEMANTTKALLQYSKISSTVEKQGNLYLIKFNKEGYYYISAFASVQSAGKYHLLVLSSQYKAKDYEKELIALLKKIVPAPAKK